ncbi:unnamed protein product, partial [Brassica rapa]
LRLCWLSLSLGVGPWRVVVWGGLSLQIKLISVYAGERTQALLTVYGCCR